MFLRVETKTEGYCKEINDIEELKNIISKELEDDVEEVVIKKRRTAKQSPISDSKDVPSNNQTHI